MKLSTSERQTRIGLERLADRTDPGGVGGCEVIDRLRDAAAWDPGPACSCRALASGTSQGSAVPLSFLSRFVSR